MRLFTFTQEGRGEVAINPDHIVAIEESDREGITIIATTGSGAFDNYRVQLAYPAVVNIIGGHS